ncbi:MAG: methyl-accepting chemotaxis protein [Gammaproteobacteria bacterium]|nr:methyl-accepting chemotaxis protein [Gammaproteobacteria bacterium]
MTMVMRESKLALGGFVVAVALTGLGLIDGALLEILQGVAPGFALAAGAALAVAGWWKFRSLDKRQQALFAGLERLMAGAETAQLTAADAGPEAVEVLGDVASALHAQHQITHSLMPSVNALIEQVNAVSERCRNALESTSSGTHEADVAVNELVQAVQEVARSAVEAADSTHQAAKEADNGKVTMTEAMGAMSSLGDQIGRASDAVTRLGKETQNIGAVLDVIRGIAEQTNLLALNAAIEAARAGEQGRGFAVVADEVRTLASRTQRSTQEIRQMIERLQGEAQSVVGVMGEGTRQATVVEELIENACISLAEIGGAVTSIDGMNTQIASAAEQQHAAVQSIHGMLSTRGTRGAALERTVEDLAEIADTLDGVSARLG